jgi:hypothetical protein
MNTPSDAPAVQQAPVTVEKVVRKVKAKKASKKLASRTSTKKTSRKKRRPFPYARVAKMWETEKTIEDIARAIGRYEKNADDPLHTMRVFLNRMHKGYKGPKGNVLKLPYRISRKALKAATKAGRKSAA